MMSNSMIETAYQILSEQSEPVPFLALWNQICEKSGLSKPEADSKIARFFSSLTLDQRFISRPGNKWDLKKRHSLKDSRIDIEAIALDDDSEETDS